jgi:uncharacterized membrane protein YqjE
LGKSISDNFNEFTTATQDYIESTISYQKLDLYKKLVKILVSGSYSLIIGFVLLIALLFLSVALGIYIGTLLDNLALGYLIMGVFYLVVLIVLLFTLKSKLEHIILRKTSRQFFNDNKESNLN